MLKLILSNGTEIEVKDGSTLFDVQVDSFQYDYLWSQLVPENMTVVKLTTDNGDLIDQRENLVVDSEHSVREKDEIHCHFYLREKTEVELLREEVARLKETSGVHDGAIEDLAVAVSGLAEEGGLA